MMVVTPTAHPFPHHCLLLLCLLQFPFLCKNDRSIPHHNMLQQANFFSSSLSPQCIDCESIQFGFLFKTFCWRLNASHSIVTKHNVKPATTSMVTILTSFCLQTIPRCLFGKSFQALFVECLSFNSVVWQPRFQTINQKKRLLLGQTSFSHTDATVRQFPLFPVHHWLSSLKRWSQFIIIVVNNDANQEMQREASNGGAGTCTHRANSSPNDWMVLFTSDAFEGHIACSASSVFNQSKLFAMSKKWMFHLMSKTLICDCNSLQWVAALEETLQRGLENENRLKSCTETQVTCHSSSDSPKKKSCSAWTLLTERNELVNQKKITSWEGVKRFFLWHNLTQQHKNACKRDGNSINNDWTSLPNQEIFRQVSEKFCALLVLYYYYL